MLGLLVLVALLYILMSIEMRDLFSPRQPATSIYLLYSVCTVKKPFNPKHPELGGQHGQPNFFFNVYHFRHMFLDIWKFIIMFFFHYSTSRNKIVNLDNWTQQPAKKFWRKKPPSRSRVQQALRSFGFAHRYNVYM